MTTTPTGLPCYAEDGKVTHRGGCGACPPDPTDPWSWPTAAHNVTSLRAGLEVIAAPGCFQYGPVTDCWAKGRTADGKRRHRACHPCIASRVLEGRPLPSVDDE